MGVSYAINCMTIHVPRRILLW